MSNQLETAVQTLLTDVTDRLNDKIERSIVDHVRTTLANYDYEGKINLLTSLKLDNKISEFEVRPVDVEARITAAADTIITNLDKQARSQIIADIARRIDSIDFEQSITNAVGYQIQQRLENFVFPNSSINFSAIKQDEIHLSGDQIQGGIIKQFGSTGIDDRATEVALTILDEHTVVENNLIAASADVKGTLTVSGDLIIHGTMPTDSAAFKSIVENATNSVVAGIDDSLFSGYTNKIFEKITAEGIDLNQITMGGEAAITGNKIGQRITESNLQKLGVVKDLQTSGESFLSEALYASNKRVGINTIDPGHALSIWDQEVEVVVAKRSQDTAMVGTVRSQNLILSSNNKNNLVCKPNGAVQINNLEINGVAMNSADSVPVTDQPRGTITWNSNPAVGSPIGWVSLGGARWAKFGVIQE
jgi:hypothetical protein